MGRTAMSKVEEAKSLRKLANELKGVPGAKADLDALAERKIRSAVKQMRGKPRAKRTVRTV